MINSLGTVKELGIEAEIPVYLRLPTPINKGGLPQKTAEKFIEDSKMHAIASHKDPSHRKKAQAMRKECFKQIGMHTNRDSKTRLMRLIRI